MTMIELPRAPLGASFRVRESEFDRPELVVLPLLAAIAVTSMAILDQLVPLAQLAVAAY
jgi:hypothetical protein